MSRFGLSTVLGVVGLSLLLTDGAQAQARKVEIATLDWPPYVSAQLPEEGATSAVLKAAFTAAGYQAHLQFLPWKRAVDATAAHDDGVQAFFPGYHCKQRPGLIASQSLGNGPLGIAELAAKPVAWSSLDDLSGKTIGVVQGYANTEDFDARAKDGRIKTDQAASDVLNLRKLALARLDGAVVDRYVLEYLMKTDATLKPYAGQIRFAAKPLEDKQLFLCTTDDDAGRALIRDFNAGLAKVDVAKTVESYFEHL